MRNLMKTQSHVDFSDYTLIIPSVSVGNIPQLTIDLLITTYELERLSAIWHPAIVPCVGSDPYDSNKSDICTACELYLNEQLKLAVIQLRSTIEKKLALNFFNDLRDVILHLGFKCTFVLASSFDYELHNISGEKFYFLSNADCNDIMRNCSVKPLQPDMNGKYYLNGDGFAVKIYQVIQESTTCTLLVKYASEGDNRPDALMMLRRLSVVMGLKEPLDENIKCPSSWRFVFGGPPPQGLY
ncbi:hypothetical protein NQ315_015585 [Exocentrus adspersus]|uniref:Proteasome assembly chaperone 2 n=1 Tax=Exocentrus adspersus TaxID=1586481 RepID=A0AAV8VA14_9CUCU|nr:hypothetical protein NQ315_015585 [Exocentrus adspersus]